MKLIQLRQFLLYSISHPRKKRDTRIANRYNSGWRRGRRRIRASFRKWKNPDGFFPAFVPASISSSSIRVSATILQNHHWNGGSPHALYIYICTRVYMYTYVCKIRYRQQRDNRRRGRGKKGPDAARTKDQKGGDPRRRAQRTNTMQRNCIAR